VAGRTSVLGVDMPPADDSVLQPDVTFAAPPFLHMLHGYVFTVCGLVSIFSFHSELPISEATGSAAWSRILLPLIIYGIISVGFHAYYIRIRGRCLRMQLGPEPDAGVTVAAATMQWDILFQCFTGQHVASNASDIVLLLGIICSSSSLYESVLTRERVSLQAVSLPLAVAGLLSLCVHTLYQLRCALRATHGLSLASECFKMK
jgi:hypothetical protein